MRKSRFSEEQVIGFPVWCKRAGRGVLNFLKRSAHLLLGLVGQRRVWPAFTRPRGRLLVRRRQEKP